MHGHSNPIWGCERREKGGLDSIENEDWNSWIQKQALERTWPLRLSLQDAFLKQMFIVYLVDARKCFRNWIHQQSAMKSEKKFHGAYILVRGDRQIINIITE